MNLDTIIILGCLAAVALAIVGAVMANRETPCPHCGDGGTIPTTDGPVCATCYHPIEKGGGA